MIPTDKQTTIDTQNDAVEDLVDDVIHSPTVVFFIDMEGIKRTFRIGHSNGFMEQLLTFGSRLGRVLQTHVFEVSTLHKNSKNWRRCGVTTHSIQKPSAKDVIFSMEVMKAYYELKPTMFVFVVNDNRYQKLAEFLNEHGKINAIISPANAHVNAIRQDCYFAIELEKLISPAEEPIDMNNYDFTEFVRLLNSSEAHLPFVGVKYFIEQKMQRLGIKNIWLRRQIIQKAKEEEIIELGSKENIEGEHPVTTCALNKKNDLVKEILDIEMYDEKDGRAVTVKKDSVTITEESKPSETVTFSSDDFSDIDSDETDSMPG
jgi:hypothetical protein